MTVKFLFLLFFQLNGYRGNLPFFQFFEMSKVTFINICYNKKAIKEENLMDRN